MRRRRRLPMLLLLLAAGGCMPHVLHAPRVERGTTGSVYAAVGRNLAAGRRDETYVPTFYTGIRQGWVAADDRSALLLGAQASPLLLLWWLDSDEPDDFLDVALATSYADLYVQPPGMRGESWHAGIGALASSALFAPYIQLGKSTSDTEGWFTTQMVAFANEPLDDATFWMPAVGWRDRGRLTNGSAVTIGLSAAAPLEGSSRDWFFSLTFSAELGLERAAK